MHWRIRDGGIVAAVGVESLREISLLVFVISSCFIIYSVLGVRAEVRDGLRKGSIMHTLSVLYFSVCIGK